MRALKVIPSLQLVVKLWMLTFGYLDRKRKSQLVRLSCTTTAHQTVCNGRLLSVSRRLFISNTTKAFTCSG